MPSAVGASPGSAKRPEERIGGRRVGHRREQRLVARLGEHQPAVRVDRVAEQVLVATGVVEADDRTADERRAAEREEVVGRVVEQHCDVARRAGRQPIEEQRGEPARLVEVLGVRPLPVAELDRDAVAELASVAPQQRSRVVGDEWRLARRRGRCAEEAVMSCSVCARGPATGGAYRGRVHKR